MYESQIEKKKKRFLIRGKKKLFILEILGFGFSDFPFSGFLSTFSVVLDEKYILIKNSEISVNFCLNSWFPQSEKPKMRVYIQTVI